ncbi:hypothetical protein JKP88DRAFT_283389 [Tribonema minus]|uniref:Uncharacterized protein n=1 Tax=Tribonema minus TaxID=303371 RepID=A0A835YI36_9STRA|nr:hypothetical protein JKP88DRAFT_283389 [Tribonema minus]
MASRIRDQSARVSNLDVRLNLHKCRRDKDSCDLDELADETGATHLAGDFTPRMVVACTKAQKAAMFTPATIVVNGQVLLDSGRSPEAEEDVLFDVDKWSRAELTANFTVDVHAAMELRRGAGRTFVRAPEVSHSG